MWVQRNPCARVTHRALLPGSVESGYATYLVKGTPQENIAVVPAYTIPKRAFLPH